MIWAISYGTYDMDHKWLFEKVQAKAKKDIDYG